MLLIDIHDKALKDGFAILDNHKEDHFTAPPSVDYFKARDAVRISLEYLMIMIMEGYDVRPKASFKRSKAAKKSHNEKAGIKDRGSIPEMEQEKQEER